MCLMKNFLILVKYGHPGQENFFMKRSFAAFDNALEGAGTTATSLPESTLQMELEDGWLPEAMTA